ncbi:tetratricopeptide repeat protein [Spirochaeta dissipatitropha]
MLTSRNTGIIWLTTVIAAIIIFSGCSTTAKLPQESNAVKNQSLDYRQLAERNLLNQRIQEAEILYRNALFLSQSIDHQSGIALALIGLGNVQKAAGNMPDAASLYRQAEYIAGRSSLSGEKVRARVALAEISLQERNGTQALELLSGLEDDLDSQAIERAMVYHSRGIAQRLNGNYGEALAALNEAIKIAERRGDLLAKASSHFQLASVYSLQNDFETALKHADISLQLDRQLENSMGVISSLQALAAIYDRMSERELASWYLLRAQSVQQGISSQESGQKSLWESEAIRME